jgi:hypothetical protein
MYSDPSAVLAELRPCVLGMDTNCGGYGNLRGLRTFNLDCNAVALDVRTGLVLDGGAIKAIQQRRVAFVHRAIRHSEETFAAKALLLNLRLKYAVSRELNQFVAAHLHLPSLAYEARKVLPHLAAFPISGTRVETLRSPVLRPQLFS